ncbi:Tox-REase-5 domain-containing protein [Krasilnikovia cinnamomea]|uniref:Tox-REase-5 domain-containing protein n=1 Tax=Krasilnikovia cinnamomea TaxID=349313 RepID=UPI00102C9235|nr:Tox-REase-5 domain-containing protein [Krasilnikovia cinnamomea]
MHRVWRFVLRKNGGRRPLASVVLLVGTLVMALTVSAAQPPPMTRTSGNALPQLHWSLWPQWDVNNRPDRGRFTMTNWSLIPREVGGEQERQWQCQMGAELHHGGPRSQALAASSLLQAARDPKDLDGDFDAARRADVAEYPLTDKRVPQETAWKAQLAPLPGADVIPPGLGYPSDTFLWEHINFDRAYDIVPIASAETATKTHDLIAAKLNSDPFLQALAAYFDDVFVLMGAPPGSGKAYTPEALKDVSADDARRFLQYGGFPRVAPERGTPEFRVEVESIKARWASCDITNPADPYHVLSDVVATAQSEWDAERGAQAGDRKTIVDAHIATWNQMRLANEAMIESIGQAWVAERALAWQRNKLSSGHPLTPSEQTALNNVIKDAQNRIGVQVGKANQNVTAATAEGNKADAAQASANTKAAAAGVPPGRGLTYAHQSVQVTKALTGAATAAAGAANTAWRASKTTGTDSDALWAQAQAEMRAVQAQFRRQAAEYAQYEAHQASTLASGQAQIAADMAVRAHDDRVKAEAAEDIAKTKAADAHAKMLAAKTERDNAASKRAEADNQRDKAAAAQTRAEQQRDVATSKNQQAQSQADIASRKRQDAEQAERHASDMRNTAVNASIDANALEARAAAAESYAAAADSDDDAQEARAAATESRAAANAATTAARNARAAADQATAAAVAARKAATEAQAAADRAKADADKAKADAAATNAQMLKAHLAAADAIAASDAAAKAVEQAKQQAAVAAAAAQRARDEAQAARTQANLSLQDAAVAQGRATAASDQAAATRDAALQTYAAADNAVAMGRPFVQTDTSAGMAVLVGQDAKTAAEQQSAAADAKSAEATRAAQAAHDAAGRASADAKAAAEAAAKAADDAKAAWQSVKDAAKSAAQAAREAAAAASADARTTQYNAQAQQDAAAAAQYATEAANEASAAWAAADEAERDAAAARAAADSAEAAAADARDAADRAERDAEAAEAAAARALEDAQQAQQAAEQAERNADNQARAAMAVNSPTGEGSVQALPHVTDQIVSQTPIVCPPLSGSRYCETTVKHHITGTIDFVLVTCPDLNDTTCPGSAVTDQIATVPVDTYHEQTAQLDRSDVLNIAQHLVDAMISDYVTCAKGVTITDGRLDTGQAKDWAVSCAWVSADIVLPAAVGGAARGIKAMRIAARTGAGVGEAYEAMRATDISTATLTKLEDDIYHGLQSSCFGTAAPARLTAAAKAAAATSRKAMAANAGCWVDLSGPGTWSRVYESMSARAAAYQGRITGVPHGIGYSLNGVKFDGFRAGVLIDAKGPGYATFVKDGRFVGWYKGADALVDQAERQLRAAHGAKIEWHVAEPDAATAIANLFTDQGISGIKIVVVP